MAEARKAREWEDSVAFNDIWISESKSRHNAIRRIEKMHNYKSRALPVNKLDNDSDRARLPPRPK